MKLNFYNLCDKITKKYDCNGAFSEYLNTYGINNYLDIHNIYIENVKYKSHYIKITKDFIT